MVALVGYQGSFAGDASKPFAFRSKEWTRVLTKQERKQKIKPIVEEEDFKIMPEQKMAKRVVNFAVAPEGNNLPTHERRNIGLTGNRSNAQKKKITKQKELSKTAFEKVLMEVKNQDQKLKETNKNIAVSIEMLQNQLSQGIKITKLQRELTEKIKNFEIDRLKNIPPRKSDFERDFKMIDTHMTEIHGLYEKLNMKCKDWKQNFKKHNMENYTFITRNDTIPRNPEPLFVDPYGYTDSIPLNEMNDYYKPFPVRLRNPSSCNKCRFVGQHRKCPSPKKRNEKHCISFENDNYDEDYAKEAWNNQYKQELHQYRPFNGRQTDAATYPSIGQSQIKPKAIRNCDRFKSASTPYGNQHDVFTNELHETAQERSERIFNQTWKDKEQIRARTTDQHIPFTRIERAFMASAISVNSNTEMYQDKLKAKIAAEELRVELENVDVNEQLKEQQIKINLLLKELEESKKDRQTATASVTSHHSNPALEPLTLINTTVTSSDLIPETPAHGEISYTMKTMLEKYDTLDNDSKNELFRYAIASGNENLQSRLLMLRQSKTGTSLAKLTKELIKLADSYKVLELKFDEQASKRRFNYQAWIMKLQPILAMFTQTASVLPNDKVVPFSDPHATGNQALYLLISSCTDSYFQ